MVSSSPSSKKQSKALKSSSSSSLKSKNNVKNQSVKAKPNWFFDYIYNNVVKVANTTVSIFHNLIYDDIPTPTTTTTTTTNAEIKKLQIRVDNLSKELQYLLQNKDILASSSNSNTIIQSSSTSNTIMQSSLLSSNSNTNIKSSSSSSSNLNIESSSSSSEIENKKRKFSAMDLKNVKLKPSLKSPKPSSLSLAPEPAPAPARRVSFGRQEIQPKLIPKLIPFSSTDILKVKLKKTNNAATIVNPAPTISAPTISLRSALKKALSEKFANISSGDNNNNDDNDNDNDWNE